MIRALHPSVYLRDDYTSDQSWSREDVRLANQVLRLCFAKAFIGLSSEDPVELEDTELLQAWRAQLKAQEDLRAVEENLGNILTLN